MKNIQKLASIVILIGLVSIVDMGWEDLMPSWEDFMGPAYPGSSSGELLKNIISASTVTETITTTVTLIMIRVGLI